MDVAENGRFGVKAFNMAELDSLLLRLHDVVDAASWEDWLQALRELFGATAAALVPLHSTGRGGSVTKVLKSHEVTDEGLCQQAAAWAAQIRTTRSKPADEVWVLTADGRSTAHEASTAGASLHVGIGGRIEVAGSQFALLLMDNAEDATLEAHRASFSRMVRYVERILGRNHGAWLAGTESSAFRQILDQSRRGILLLDSGFHVVFANRVAEEVLARAELLRRRSGQVVAGNPLDERRFREALNLALSEGDGQSVVTLRGSSDQVEVVASIARVASTPPPLEIGMTSGAISVRLTRPLLDRTNVATGYFENIFGLTAKEAQLALLLVSGLELNKAAQELEIAYDTARQYLKLVFSKTGVRKQRDLVNLLRMSLPLLTN